MPRTLNYLERIKLESYKKVRARTRFVPRCPELLAIEGDYGDFKLSCRHRDILRCSDTPHFISCFAPTGFHNTQPLRYCEHDNVAILFKTNRAGQYQCRAFVMFVPAMRRLPAELVVQKFYGNGLNETNVLYTLKSKTGYEVRSSGGDFHF